MSFRAWLSIITFVLIGGILFLSRHEVQHAWSLLEQVNVWILLLLIPGQLLVYYAGGEMVFSYLQAKKSVDHVSRLEKARMALEMNFVNHILPSGGVSGISYMTWRLSKHGVSSGRAAMAQVVRFALGFVAFIVLLLISVLMVTIDGNLNRWIIFVSSLLVLLMAIAIFGGIFLVSSHSRMKQFAGWTVRNTNAFVSWVTFRRKQNILVASEVEAFFSDVHDDFVALRADKRVLLKPFLWGLVFNLADVGLFLVTFWALGAPVNPAPILIGYGVAATAGFFVITPGGAGAYEAIMVTFLAVAGIAQGTAIAGILLARVILLLGTIIFGYVFYQHALLKYGKHRS